MKIFGSIIGIVILLAAGPAFGQARWRGGDGNWLDDNWTGGSGANGVPGSGQDVTLPGSTGFLLADHDVGNLGLLSHLGGTLNIGPAGQADFAGNVRIGDGAGAEGELIVDGQLFVGGGLDVAYGAGNGAGGSSGLLAVGGNAVLQVSGNLDTWWDPGAVFSITGGNANIEVGTTFFLGTAATLEANINSDSFSTINVLGNLNFAGGIGTLDVNFVDGFTPSIGTSWTLFDAAERGGEIPVLDLPDTGIGTLLSVNYSEGGELGQIVTLDMTNTLNLKVDTTTGSASIENPIAGGQDLVIDGYIVRSDSGALIADSLTGIGAAGWAPGLAPSQSGQLLSETNFSSSTAVATGATFPIGGIFDATKAEDLTFEFHVAGGVTLPGTVEYVGALLGDFNSDGLVNDLDIDLLGAAIRVGSEDPQFDLDGSGAADLGDLTNMVSDVMGTWFGDSNLDGEFNSTDLVRVFQAGEYEDGVPLNSIWSHGDWNQDQEFDSSDLVKAFQDGGFEQGPRGVVANVPEPSSCVLVVLGFMGVPFRRR